MDCGLSGSFFFTLVHGKTVERRGFCAVRLLFNSIKFNLLPGVN
jgi:hypothetical protein